MKIKLNVVCFFCLTICSNLFAQQSPSLDEKFPYLVTFGKASDKNWGDDDFVQTIFFAIPTSEKKPLFINVFDPGCGGQFDELHGDFNSKTKYTIIGGKGAHSNVDSKNDNPVGNFKAGVELTSKTFGNEPATDGKWITLGPFNPVDGELQPDFGGYVFKLVIEGLSGDDGNLYKLFLSSEAANNKAIEGANMFMYEFTVRMSDERMSIGHLYPFVTSNVVTVKINVFDFDDDGIIRLISVNKKGTTAKSSSDGKWFENIHEITKEEHNTSLDIQFIKNKDSKNNNIVVTVKNQYNELMPFFAAPIGGVPKFKYKIGVKVDN